MVKVSIRQDSLGRTIHPHLVLKASGRTGYCLPVPLKPQIISQSIQLNSLLYPDPCASVVVRQYRLRHY